MNSQVRISRRALLRSAGAGLAAVSGLASAAPRMAGPLVCGTGRPDHFVPADKRICRGLWN